MAKSRNNPFPEDDFYPTRNIPVPEINPEEVPSLHILDGTFLNKKDFAALKKLASDLTDWGVLNKKQIEDNLEAIEDLQHLLDEVANAARTELEQGAGEDFKNQVTEVQVATQEVKFGDAWDILNEGFVDSFEDDEYSSDLDDILSPEFEASPNTSEKIAIRLPSGEIVWGEALS